MSETNEKIDTWIIVTADLDDGVSIERICVKEKDLEKFFKLNERKKYYQGMSWDYMKETDCCKLIYDAEIDGLVINEECNKNEYEYEDSGVDF